MAERHIPRKARILGEISLMAAGAVTVVTGGVMLHSRANNETTANSTATQNNAKPFLGYSDKNEGFPTGTIVMLVGGSLFLTGTGMLTRETPDQNSK